ncbi:MAG TPA: V-type ATPase subunit [Thermodesulfovibrionales bacterium]|nr:V-type ATPase subunit [Thermodesulfovibrionales bacterium]
MSVVVQMKRSHMDLLEYPEDRGYPTDYLLSRIKGRRGLLIRDWRPLVYDAAPLESLSSSRYRGLISIKSPDAVWRYLVQEYRWVYVQMNGSLRRIFYPFFLYTELRTIFICLRHAKEKSEWRRDDLLATSLLSEEIKTVLSTSVDFSAAIAEIERIFQAVSPNFVGLTKLLDEEGLRGVEQRLTNTYLVHTMGTDLHPLIRDLFKRIIDSRNIMSLFKYQRLDSKAAPVFIPGGSITVARLQEIIKKGDTFAVTTLIRELTGIKADTPNPTQIESSLYKGITKFLRKTGKHPFGAEPIMDYLWRCSIEAMNLGVLFYGKDLERDIVTAELVH